jgi:hypothetical protein
VPRQHAEELRPVGFPSLSPFKKSCCLSQKKKKTRKSGYLFVKLDYVFILLIVMYLALNHLLNHYFFQFNPFTIDFYV